MVNDNIHEVNMQMMEDAAKEAGVMSEEECLKEEERKDFNRFSALKNRDAAISAMCKEVDTLLVDDDYLAVEARGDDEIEAIRAEFEDFDGIDACLPGDYDGGVLRVIRCSGEVAAYAFCDETNRRVDIGHFGAREAYRLRSRDPISTIPIEGQQFRIGFGHLLMRHIMTTGTSFKMYTQNRSLNYIAACLGFSLDEYGCWVYG